jgi:hypothetical protein
MRVFSRAVTTTTDANVGTVRERGTGGQAEAMESDRMSDFRTRTWRARQVRSRSSPRTAPPEPDPQLLPIPRRRRREDGRPHRRHFTGWLKPNREHSTPLLLLQFPEGSARTWTTAPVVAADRRLMAADAFSRVGRPGGCGTYVGLVHRRRDALKHATMRPDDRLGGFGPGERRGVLLPGAHVRVQMVTQGRLRVEVRHAQGLFAEGCRRTLPLG